VQQVAGIRVSPQSPHFLGSLGQDDDISHIDAGVAHGKKVALAVLIDCMSLASNLCMHPLQRPLGLDVMHLISHVLEHPVRADVLAAALKVVVGSASLYTQLVS
jgi:hypothetical protein